MTVLHLVLLLGTAWAQDHVTPPHGADFDDDAWIDTVDCDPFEPTAYPGAPELCNHVDDDCNGEVDDNPECRGCSARSAYSEGLGLTLLLLPPMWWRRRRGGLRAP